jgi:hypothetical protein
VSVMDAIHEVKLYNANSTLKEEVAEDKVWKFKLVEAWTKEIKYIDSFEFDVLNLCKVKSGNIFLLNEFWDTVKDSDGKAKKALFYTNEHSMYTRKTDTMWVKWAWNILWFFTKEELDQMFKKKMLNGNVNPFYKQWAKMDWEPYDATHMKDTYVLYGKFITWDYKDEYFKMYLSLSWLWKTWKDWAKCQPEVWSFLSAVNDWLESWNEVRKENWKSIVKNVDPSQLDMKIWFKEIDINSNRVFIPTFDLVDLSWMRWNNTEDVEYITDLQMQYFEQEFWSMWIAWNIWDISLQWQAKLNAPSWEEIKDAEIEWTHVPKNEAPVKKVELQDYISIEDIPF